MDKCCFAGPALPQQQHVEAPLPKAAVLLIVPDSVAGCCKPGDEEDLVALERASPAPACGVVDDALFESLCKVYNVVVGPAPLVVGREPGDGLSKIGERLGRRLRLIGVRRRIILSRELLSLAGLA